VKKINQTEFEKLEAIKEKYGWDMGRDSAIVMPCANKACPYRNPDPLWVRCAFTDRERVFEIIEAYRNPDPLWVRCAAPVPVAIDAEGRCPVWQDLNKEAEQEIPTPSAEMIRMLLELIDVKDVPLAVIEGWTAGQRLEVVDYASCVQLRAGDHDDIEVPPIPEVLSSYRRSS